MNPWLRKCRTTPARVRTVPFVLFLSLTFLQGRFGDTSQYWVYLGKTLLGVGLVCFMHPLVKEMRWSLSWEAVAVGVGVCVMWIGLDRYYTHLGKTGAPWNPPAQFGTNSILAWCCISGRILGSSIIVPPLEEVFYRSFLYRYIVKPDFESVPFSKFHPLAFAITAVVFGFSHNEWLAGILCALAYQGLVLHKNRLGDAMTAHAITNFLLGLWVVWRGAWNFW